MTTTTASPRGLTRRQLLSRATAAGASFVVGAGFIAAPDAATSSITTAASPMPAPPPPYRSGMAMPIQPPSAIAR